MELVHPIDLSQTRRPQRRQSFGCVKSQEKQQLQVRQISGSGAGAADIVEPEHCSREEHLQRQAPQLPAFEKSTEVHDQLHTKRTVDLESIIEKATTAAVLKMQQVLIQVAKNFMEVLKETDTALPSARSDQKKQRKREQQSKSETMSDDSDDDSISQESESSESEYESSIWGDEASRAKVVQGFKDLMVRIDNLCLELPPS